MTCDACGDKPKNESKHFPKAVVEINNPESLVLLRKVVIPASIGDDTEFPPIVGKYYNVLLHYDANGRNYLYSSDGIPTVLDATIPPEIYERIENLEEELEEETNAREATDAILQNNITAEAAARSSADTTLQNNIGTEISARTNADTALQNNITAEATARSNADTALGNRLTTVEGIAGTALQPQSINKVVMTDINLNANTSTTTVQIDGAKENILTGATSTKNVALPVASTTQAGVMNSSTYDAVTSNTNNINAIMNGAVAITGISANPSQSDLTTAWQTETGLTTLINRASIYDVTNNKVWTYYTNDTTWHAASNSSQVTISTFTNNSEGTIRGSTNVGQIFAENDGTGSVNGWDNLSNNVSTNTSNIAALQAAIPTVNDATLTIQNNGTNVATFTANSATSTTANIVSPVNIGAVLSTPSDVAYVNTNNIIDGAVTANKIDFSTLRTVLYDNSTGSTGTITLSESAANFERLRIYYRNNTSGYQSVDVYSPNNKNVDLTTTQKDVSGSTDVVYGQTVRKLISGTAITNVIYGEFHIGAGNTCGVSSSNYIHITRVEGWVI